MEFSCNSLSQCFAWVFYSAKENYFFNKLFKLTTSVERDLGVLLSSDLRWKPQCDEAATKANRMLGFLKKTF